MDFNKYDYVEPKGVNGKILITSFPGLDENGIFQEVNFLSLTGLSPSMVNLFQSS